MAFDRNSTSGNSFDDALGHAYSGMPIINFCFSLRVEGLYNIPLRSIKGLTKKNSYEPIIEGGLNDYPHMKRKQVTEPYQFQVERYVTTGLLDPLSNGAILTLPVLLFVWKDQDGKYPEKTYVFTGCQVAGKEYGELNAEHSGLMVETITIMFEEMFDVPAKFWDKGSFTDAMSVDSSIETQRKNDETSAAAAKDARDKYLAELKEKQEEARKRQELLDKEYAAKQLSDKTGQELQKATDAADKAAAELKAATEDAEKKKENSEAAKKELDEAATALDKALREGGSWKDMMDAQRRLSQAELSAQETKKASDEADAKAADAKKASEAADAKKADAKTADDKAKTAEKDAKEARKNYPDAAAEAKADSSKKDADTAVSDYDKKYNA